MKKLFLINFLFIVILPVSGHITDTLSNKPDVLPWWTLYLPGASYYYQKDYAKGTVFTLLEVSGIFIGIKHSKTLKRNSSGSYYNYPLLPGLQAYQTEKLTNFKNQLEIIKYHNPDFRYHDISEKDLYLAPFKIKNITTPIFRG
jgi:hypothetical protein